MQTGKQVETCKKVNRSFQKEFEKKKTALYYLLLISFVIWRKKQRGEIQTTFTYTNFKVTSILIELFKNTRISIFSAKSFSAFFYRVKRLGILRSEPTVIILQKLPNVLHNCHAVKSVFPNFSGKSLNNLIVTNVSFKNVAEFSKTYGINRFLPFLALRNLDLAQKCSDEDLILLLADKRKFFRDFIAESYISAKACLIIVRNENKWWV